MLWSKKWSSVYYYMSLVRSRATVHSTHKCRSPPEENGRCRGSLVGGTRTWHLQESHLLYGIVHEGLIVLFTDLDHSIWAQWPPWWVPWMNSRPVGCLDELPNGRLHGRVTNAWTHKSMNALCHSRWCPSNFKLWSTRRGRYHAHAILVRSVGQGCPQTDEMCAVLCARQWAHGALMVLEKQADRRV